MVEPMLKRTPHRMKLSQWIYNLTSRAFEHGGLNLHLETSKEVSLCQVLGSAKSFAVRYCCHYLFRKVQE